MSFAPRDPTTRIFRRAESQLIRTQDFFALSPEARETLLHFALKFITHPTAEDLYYFLQSWEYGLLEITSEGVQTPSEEFYRFCFAYFEEEPALRAYAAHYLASCPRK